MNSASMLFIRALLAFLILPGVVAGLLPWRIAAADPGRTPGWPPGVIVLAVGVVIVLWCVRDFYVAGKGTLAPWDPPRHLVHVGLYQFTRNPMYLGVLTIVSGWGLLTGSPRVLGYAVVLAVIFHLRVILFEEPWLTRTHGDDWRRYASHVPRWLF